MAHAFFLAFAILESWPPLLPLVKGAEDKSALPKAGRKAGGGEKAGGGVEEGNPTPLHHLPPEPA